MMRKTRRQARRALLSAALALPCLAGMLALSDPALAKQVPRVTLCEGTGACDGADVRLQIDPNAATPHDAEFGFSTAMGYLNGDRFADLVVGAPKEGKVYVFLGREDVSMDPNEGLLVADPNTASVVFTGDPNAQFGFSVAIAPRDPNNAATDLTNPLLIGAPGNATTAGAAYVVNVPMGASGVQPIATTTLRVATLTGAVGEDAGYMVAFGPVLSAARDDFIVSARTSQGGKGVVYIAPRTSTGTVSLTSAGVRQIIGSRANEGLGEFLLVDDFLDDGEPYEIAIGAVGTVPSDTTNFKGRVYVLNANPAANIDLSTAAARRVQGDSLNDFFGFSLASGDFDHDGAVDLAVGAIYADRADPNAPTGHQLNSGAVYVFNNGKVQGFSTSEAGIQDATVAQTHSIWGHRKWDELGFSLASGNLDGSPAAAGTRDDLVAGARWHDRDLSDANEVDEGAVYVFNGATAPIATNWPANVDCNPSTCETVPPAGVDTTIFGSGFQSSFSDEAGFSVAVGDFNQSSLFDDIAISSITHERVYLVSVNNADDPNTPVIAGRQTDARRDVRDRDDDGDGYLDTQEDANGNGALDANESDPLTANFDRGVAIDPNTPATVTCDPNFMVTILVRNASRRLSVDPNNLRLEVDVPPIFSYDPNSATIMDPNGNTTTIPGASFPFPTGGSGRLLTASTALVPAGGTFKVTFQLRVINNPLLTSGRITANVLPAALVNELPFPHAFDPNNSAGFAAPNTDFKDISLLCPDLKVAKTDSPDPVIAGDPNGLSYTVSVSNTGTAAASNVSAVDTLPAGVTFVSASGSGWTCGPPAGSNVTCTRPTLAVAAAFPIMIQVGVGAGVPPSPPALTDTVQVSSSNKELNGPGNDPNNMDTEDTTVLTRADLSIVKTDSPDPVNATQTLTYTLAVANAGPSNAASLTVTDVLPAGITFASASGSGWTCNNAAGTVTCTRPSLAAGTPAPNITITATVGTNTTGTLSNTATVSSTTTDPSAGNNSSTATTQVKSLSNLSIVKTDSPDPVDATGTLTYTLAVSNAGPSDANSVTVTDTLPAGVTFVSATGTGWTCGNVSGTVTCTLPTLGVASAPAITITVTANTNTFGTISNTGSVVAGNNSDPNATDDSSTAMTNVKSKAELSINKTDAPDPVAPSSALVYTLSVANAGPSDANTVTVVDTLDNEVTFVSATGTGWACANASGTVTCTRPSLGVGAAPDITINVTTNANASGTLSNTSTVSSANNTDTNSANNSATATTIVATSADLSITKTDSPDPVAAGDPNGLTYMLTVTNAGPNNAGNVTVTDTLPPDVTFVSAVASGWSCNNVSNTVTCTRNKLPDGQSDNIPIHVTVNNTSGSLLTNTVTVAASNNTENMTNNSATETTTVITLADLSIAKSDSPDPVGTSAALTYTLTVTNAGPGTPSNLTVTDTLDAEVVFGTATGTGWTCSESMGVVTCTRPSLGVTTAPAITITTTTSSTATGTLTNTANVTASGNTDPSSGNDMATETTTVATAADLSITKTDSHDPVVPSDPNNLAYTLTIANGGPDKASGLTVTDMLPAGVTFASTTAPGWSCGNSSGTVTCTRPNLANGSMSTITIDVTVDATATGILMNTAMVSASNNSDPNAGNNTAMEPTTVDTTADLSITKSDSPDPVATSSSLTYTLTVANGGPHVASSLTVTDTLPADVSFGSATGTGWTCNEAMGVVTCTRPSLGVSTAPNITIMTTTLSTASGTLSNSATVSALNNTDPNSGNNMATATTTVATAADLSITKTDSHDPVVPSDPNNLSYTLTVANGGPDKASGLTVTDMLPAGVTFASTTAPGWSCGHVMGTVTCTRTNLANGSMSTITIDVTVDATATGILMNTAMVSASNNSDPNAGNNTAMEPTTVDTTADLSILKTASPDPNVVTGGTLTYTLSVTNSGPDVASNVMVTDALPAGVTFSSVTPGSGWSCGESMGTVTCMLATLGVATAPDITIDVMAGAPTTVTNTASVSASNNTDSNSGNDSGSVMTEITASLSGPPPPDLQMIGNQMISWNTVPGAVVYNIYRGDLSVLRTQGIYTQTSSDAMYAQRFCGMAGTEYEDGFLPAVGRAVFYLMSWDNGAIEGSLGQNSAGQERPNAHPCQ